MLDSSIILDVPIIDITEYRKRNPDKDISKFKCAWPLDMVHDEVVAVASLFDGQLEIAICDWHLGWHRGILTLYKAGVDIDTILSMSRDRIMAELVKRGLIPICQ